MAVASIDNVLYEVRKLSLPDRDRRSNVLRVQRTHPELDGTGLHAAVFHFSPHTCVVRTVVSNIVSGSIELS